MECDFFKHCLVSQPAVYIVDSGIILSRQTASTKVKRHCKCTIIVYHRILKVPFFPLKQAQRELTLVDLKCYDVYLYSF